MLNNVIVDKLRIALPFGDIVKAFVKRKSDNNNEVSEEEIQEELKRIKDSLDETLKSHLPTSAYVTSYRHAYLRIEFNPTRYSKSFGEIHDDVNLQMIPEAIFLRLFKAIEAISPIIIEKANVVELNLTKNILLNKKVPEYMDMLLNVKSAYGLYPVSISSKGSKSIYFSSLAHDYRERDYVGNRLIKFYDKTYQLKFVKGKDLTKLKLRESLTAAEKKQLGERYSEINNTINLDDANLLRVELTYLYNKQISKIAKFIGGENKTKLDVPLIMDKLQKNELYNLFDDFFEEELKTFIFNNDIRNDITLNKKDQKYTQILPRLSLGEHLNIESEMYYFLNLLETAGMNINTVNAKLKKINTGIINNKFYCELYKALFLNEAVIPNKINLDLYQQLQKINRKNIEDGNTTISDDIDEYIEDDDEDVDYEAELYEMLMSDDGL